MRRIPVLAGFDALRSAALALLLCLAATMPPSKAFAHAVLVSSTPEQGQRLDAPPKVLLLHFSEPVTQVMTTLVSRNGAPVALPSKVSGSEVRIELIKPLPAGAYALSWHVVSEDGHPVAASIVFAVGRNAILAGLADTTATAGWLQTLTFAIKLAFYMSCLSGVGGTFFSIWIERGAPTRWSAVLLVSGALCALLLVGLLGLEETASPVRALGDLQTWFTAAKSSLANSMAFVGLALSLSFLAHLGTRSGRALSAASLVALGPAFATTGHASGAGIAWLSFAAVSVHVEAVCFWAGALPGLWSVLGPDSAGRREALSRFSSAILFSVAAIIMAGSYLGYIQVETISGLLHTDYGKVLVAKLALVGTALGLGAFNRVLLTPRVELGDLSAAKAMRAVVSVEILLIVLVLCVTSLWRFTPPPRALALRPALTSIHLHDTMAMAMVSFKTKPDLSFDVELSIETGNFDPLDPHEVTLKMSAADGSVAPFRVPIRRVSPGIWSAEHFQAPCDCRWNVRVDVLVSDFDMVTLNGTVKLLALQ